MHFLLVFALTAHLPVPYDLVCHRAIFLYHGEHFKSLIALLHVLQKLSQLLKQTDLSGPLSDTHHVHVVSSQSVLKGAFCIHE